jgi:hypothetical protein
VAGIGVAVVALKTVSWLNDRLGTYRKRAIVET